jgi:hypothetical protein
VMWVCGPLQYEKDFDPLIDFMPKDKSKNKKTDKSKKSNSKKSTQPPGGMALVPQALRELSMRLDNVESQTAVMVDKKDEKKSPVSVQMERLKAVMLRRGLNTNLRFRHTRDAPLKVLVAERVTATSSNNTALTAVSSLLPFGIGDAVIFATVYDEVRCTGVEVRFSFCPVNSSVPSGALVNALGAIAFDPATNGVYASVAQVCEAKVHYGPFQFSISSNTQPVITAKKGHCSFFSTIPPSVQSGSSAVIGSNWTASTDTSAVVGYVKPYVDQLGTAIASQIQYIFMYHLEFAFRT